MLALSARGLNACEITRHTGVPRSTVRDWRGGLGSTRRYNFTNASEDILTLFTATCDQLGIAWRRMNARNISVAKRESVARMDSFVGPKS